MASTSTTPNSSFHIPLVDFSKYQHGTPSEQKACIASIMDGFTTSGFLYLTNSGLSPAEAYEWSEAYFKLPLEEKMKHPNSNKEANRGYSGIGVEKTTNADLESGGDAVEKLRALLPDLKESLEIGSDEGRYPAKPWKNHYPESALPGFGDAMGEFYNKCDDLHHQLLSAIAEGLGLQKDWFKQYVTAGDHVLRLLHYPSVPKAVLGKEGAVRAGSHTDYGTVTLLFQDMSGGLQVRTPEGMWLDVEPVEGAIVINAGDMLQIWTNDVIKSTHHRVVSPPNPVTREDGSFSARYSIAYFAHPDHERLINAIENCVSESRPKKYGPIVPGDWMVKRLTATY
ncbi:Clavaminate synthase-like protein [Lophiostoma macrostomum CBS 122681]|uniref:Clavaminate synthase-like protein n=1 Tax=Lophiostoma macrostomum CBS 122681 TaxID=1314788 RepID=A0A6A6TRG8_9PLEO|nr:Clavaminate synthase-like protein [Lophiostoma macrostomum CBS 122681]